MHVSLDLRSPVPIGAQIAEGIQLALARGELKPGEQLPTVRQLAVDLRVNSNTVARVYSDLEKAGVLETRRGCGSFVRAQPAARSQKLQAGRLRALVKEFAKACLREGFALSEAQTALREIAAAHTDKEEQL